MRIRIKAESAINPGNLARERDADDDCVIYEGTVNELRSIAEDLRAQSAEAGAGRDLFLFRCARTIDYDICLERRSAEK